VFDLKYRVQTGAADDVQYHFFWEYGGAPDQVKDSSFIGDVRKKGSRVYYVRSPFRKREWAAVEYRHGQALALYFDLDGDGSLSENERILPTRKEGQAIEFITPDFIHHLEGGGQVLCRTLLQVTFYGDAKPTNFWSPAAVLEGKAVLNGRPARLVLFASSPGGDFDSYGSSFYALQLGEEAAMNLPYASRERLSRVICCGEGQFYRLTIEGRRTNGLPARAFLVKDGSPTGALAVKMAGPDSVSLPTTLKNLYLHGLDDKAVFLQAANSKGTVVLPEGTYELENGMANYRSSNNDWEVLFFDTSVVRIKPSELCEVMLGEPSLTVRAVEARDRDRRQVTGLARFKQGTRIYIEPRIVGKGQQVFRRFRQANMRGQRVDRPPKITITRPDGKELLSQVMEYG
jgi:hypothetical protein